MCGKFTAMFSWSEVVEFSQPLDAGPRVGSNDDVVDLPADEHVACHHLRSRIEAAVALCRLRWGFPHREESQSPTADSCAVRDHRHDCRLPKRLH